MRIRGRVLLAVVLAAVFVFAAAYYGRQGNGTGQPVLTREVRHEGASNAEPTAQPGQEALPPGRGEAPAEARFEPAAQSPAQAQSSDDVDERIRSFTIPVERTLAGMEGPPLKVAIGPVPEFKETLRQFAMETDDPGWSVATETRIFSEISQATGLSASDVRVDCRTTMCRVLLTKPSSSPNPRYRGFNDLVDSFGLKTRWILAIPDENGTPVNFAYVQRVEGAATQSGSP